jgi:ubiquinone/menaquinone biosynthesis C-methylase UbiE
MSYLTPEGAAQWHAGSARREPWLAATTRLLFELAGVGPGMRVLDCGCGSGEMTLELARTVSPGGRAVGVDASQPMIEIARGTANAVEDVEFRVADLQTLDVGEERFDAAVARNVVPLVPDEHAALRMIRAALQPGARFACCVFTPGRNPRFTMPIEVIRELGHEPAPDSRLLAVLRLGSEELLTDALQRAGFRDLVAYRVEAQSRYEDFEELVADFRRHTGVVELLESLDEAERAPAWDLIANRLQAFRVADGAEVPGEQLVAAGTA